MTGSGHDRKIKLGHDRFWVMTQIKIWKFGKINVINAKRFNKKRRLSLILRYFLER
jgi:hypothetical protein